LSLPIAWYVTPADISDSQGARRLLGGLAYFVPRLKKIWADAAYRGKELAQWCQQQGEGWELEVVEREPGTHGFRVQPRRWVVERSFAWLSQKRRLAKDYERTVQTSETLIEIVAVRLVLRRLPGPVTQTAISHPGIGDRGHGRDVSDSLLAARQSQAHPSWPPLATST
jgi:transposase